ncbi:MAG: polymer-forming cytoskeletal protein [Nitrospirota bacterium]|jgi:cytoskeletal protein CcmA (bactofilin family)
MFQKNEKLETFVGKNTHIRGDLSTKGTLRIDGQVTGNVAADWVILGDKAVLKGDIQASGVVVGGTVEGNLSAKEVVEIKRKGQVTGDVVTSKLLVIEGGVLDGKVAMQREASNLIELDQEKFKEVQATQ